jgi:hypothetical protein
MRTVLLSIAINHAAVCPTFPGAPRHPVGICRHSVVPTISVPTRAITADDLTSMGDPLPSWNDTEAKKAILAFQRPRLEAGRAQFRS